MSDQSAYSYIWKPWKDWRVWLAIAGANFIFVLNDIVRLVYQESQVAEIAIFTGFAALMILPFAALIQGTWYVTSRVRLSEWGLFRWIIAHALLGVGFILVYYLLHISTVWAIAKLQIPVMGSSMATTDTPIVWFAINNWVTFAMAVGVYHGIAAHLRWKDREVAAAQLSAQLSEARFQALQMQLRPHFLFNALNSISELIYHDPPKADLMIGELSDLLRISLDQEGGGDVELKEELEFVELYLRIEQARFTDRLILKQSIEPGALQAQVPQFILQPVVENAVKHAVAVSDQPVSVEILIERVVDQLHLHIGDSGPGLEDVLNEGHGLRLTRKRLEQRYGQSHSFIIENGVAGGVEVNINIPFVPVVQSEQKEAELEHPIAHRR